MFTQGFIMNQVMEATKNLMTTVYPSIGIDIDGCIDEFPIFFQLLSNYWPGKVYVITFRSDREKTKNFLTEHEIKYDELILVNSFEEKGIVITREGIMTFFDDQPEVLKTITPHCNVMLVRNEGNFDFEDKKWMMSNRTGKIV